MASQGTRLLQRAEHDGAGSHADPRRGARALGRDERDVLRARAARSGVRPDLRWLSLVAAAAALASLACSSSDDAAPTDATGPFEGEGDPFLATVPRATCRGGDSPETGLQGLGTDVRCNLDVKGQVDVAHFLSVAWYGDCAYVNGP